MNNDTISHKKRFDATQRGNVHDNNPLPSICWERWKRMCWRDAVDEAALLMHMAAKLDEVRALHDVRHGTNLAEKNDRQD